MTNKGGIPHIEGAAEHLRGLVGGFANNQHQNFGHDGSATSFADLLQRIVRAAIDIFSEVLASVAAGQDISTAIINAITRLLAVFCRVQSL